MSESWILNASPVITMAKAGYLHLFDELAAKLLIPEPVAREILAAPPSGSPSNERLGKIGRLLSSYGRGAGELGVERAAGWVPGEKSRGLSPAQVSSRPAEVCSRPGQVCSRPARV